MMASSRALVAVVLLLGKFFRPAPDTTPSLQLQQQKQQSWASSLEVSVLSWNILAPCYTLPHHLRSQKLLRQRDDDTYTTSNASTAAVTVADCMEWSYRRPRIVETIASYSADLVFLQEVQLDCWPQLSKDLAQQGYQTAIVQEVNRGLPVTTVILLHDRRQEEWQVVAVESRSRALLVTLECRQQQQQQSPNGDTIINENPTHLFLANVHLQAGRKEFVTRYHQVKSLLQRLLLQTQRVQVPTSKATTADMKPPFVLLMGDWNTLPTDPLHTLLTKAKLPENHGLPQLFPNLPLLPLKDIYEQQQQQSSTSADMKKKELAWTHSCGAILDYVFASPCAEILDLLAHDDDDDNDTTTKKTIAPRSMMIPNADFPSDHIPIGGTLRFNSIEKSLL